MSDDCTSAKTEDEIIPEQLDRAAEMHSRLAHWRVWEYLNDAEKRIAREEAAHILRAAGLRIQGDPPGCTHHWRKDYGNTQTCVHCDTTVGTLGNPSAPSPTS